MKKMKSIYTLILVALLAIGLSACDTEEKAQEAPPVDQNVEENVDGDKVDSEDQDSKDEGNQDVDNETGGNDQTTGKDLPEKKMVTVTIEGMEEEQEGTLFKSEQGYYLYVLPRMSALGEEPGKDIILTEYYDQHWMRIEKLPNNIDIEEFKANAEVELKEVGEIWDEKESPYFPNAKVYMMANNDQFAKVIILNEVEGELFRITMVIASHESAEGVHPRFIAMLQTMGIQ